MIFVTIGSLLACGLFPGMFGSLHGSIRQERTTDTAEESGLLTVPSSFLNIFYPVGEAARRPGGLVEKYVLIISFQNTQTRMNFLWEHTSEGPLLIDGKLTA